MNNFIWIGSRTWEAECLYPWIKISFSITLEGSQSHIPGISLENILGKRQFWGSQDLFDCRLWKVMASIPDNKMKNGYFLSYIPLPFCKTWPFKPVWQAPTYLLRLWNDKILTRQWFVANGLPTYPFKKIKHNDWPSYSDLLVLQARDGSCGMNTYIANLENLQSIFHASCWKEALITPFVNGWIINGHVLIFEDGRIEIPWPSLQLVTHFTGKGFIKPIYAGNDFLAFQELISKQERQYIRNLLQRLGELAVYQGFKGILGADLLYDPENKNIGFLEINPRLQGSTGILSRLELAAGIIPSPVRIFLSLLGQNIEPVHYPHEIPSGPGIPVSQYIVRRRTLPDIVFDNHVCLRYGKAVSDVTQKLVAQERILATCSIFRPNFEIKDELFEPNNREGP